MVRKKSNNKIGLEQARNSILIQSRIANAVSEERKKLEEEGYDVPNTMLYVQGDTREKFEPEKSFTKSFNKKLEEIESIYGFDLTEKGIIYTLSSYINYEDNLLCHPNGNPLYRKDLEKVLSLGHNAVDKYMSSLIKKGVFAKVLIKRSVHYYMNPFIFYKGNRIDNTLLNMFTKSE